MRFEKWQALGNDYLIVEARHAPFELTPARIRLLCSAHFGAHSDGLLLIGPPAEGENVASLRIYNPDGSEAELSGNGVREAVLYLRHAGWTDQDEFTIETAAGPVKPHLTGPDSATVAMGRAATTSDAFPGGPDDGRGTVEAGGREWSFQHVSVGNPQCAIRVDEGLEELDLEAIGPSIESDQIFPQRTNVSFFSVDGSVVRARIFERGVGETLSSGTGAAGAAVAAHLDGAPASLTVRLDGGELGVEIGEDLEIALTGTAEPVYAGEFSAQLIARLRAL